MEEDGQRGRTNMVKMVKYLMVLLATMVIHISVSDSFGQCAWVLWEGQGTGPIRRELDWELLAAYPTYDKCVRDAQDKCKFWVTLFSNAAKSKSTLNDKLISRVTVLTSTSYILHYETKTGKSSEIFLFQCFPDTIDPRKQ